MVLLLLRKIHRITKLLGLFLPSFFPGGVRRHSRRRIHLCCTLRDEQAFTRQKEGAVPWEYAQACKTMGQEMPFRSGLGEQSRSTTAKGKGKSWAPGQGQKRVKLRYVEWSV